MDTTGVEGRGRRGPGAVDLLMLVGVSALGLPWIGAWARTAPKYEEFLWISPGSEPHSWLLGPAYELRRWLLPVLGLLSLAVLASCLRPPRPTPAELFSRPGLFACLVASAVVLVQWGIALVLGKVTGATAWWYVVSRALYGKGAAGLAVAIAWGLLALLRRWRPSPGWRDRVGLLVGAAWLVVWFVSLLLVFYPRHAPVPAGWSPHTIASGAPPGEPGRRGRRPEAVPSPRDFLPSPSIPEDSR